MNDLPDNVDLQWLGRQLLTLREDLREPRSASPAFNAVSSAEFHALFQAHRSLRDAYEKLRGRVEALEAKALNDVDDFFLSEKEGNELDETSSYFLWPGDE